MLIMADEQTLFLCNFDEKHAPAGFSAIDELWSGKWGINNIEISKEILSNLDSDNFSGIIESKLKQEPIKNEPLQIAISAFLTFKSQNWDAHPEKVILEEYLGTQWPESIDVTQKFQYDSETLSVNVKHAELLYLSSKIFGALCSFEGNFLHLWWNLRIKVTLQRVLEESSATLYSEIEILIAKLVNESQKPHWSSRPRLKVLLYTEISQAYLLYGRVQKTEEYLVKASQIAGLKLELTGILGKRTKWQQQAVPQLALNIELDDMVERSTAEDTHGGLDVPGVVELQDDVRLDKIEYNEKINQPDLPSLEQTLCLLNVQYLQKAQPRDNLMEEELQPYIEAVLKQKMGPWATRTAALLVKCKLGANHKRTVEQSMMQCEAIVNDRSDIAGTSRLSYIWASGLTPTWAWQQQLADLYLSLGLVKAALDQYEKLQLWEDVIVCYTMLQLRHKAAEVIQNQINIKPTVKLYCLLGDATDDVTCYETAWHFSDERSSRAQRHWGFYYYNRKMYEEAIPHLLKSVEINSIQERVWLRLGYAALTIEDWDLSATAYRRYTYLQPNSFEAWNNLAKVYVNQGDRPRAYRALMEALRFNYDNWKLWENVILISIDTAHYDDVIRGIHRLLDLQHKYDDFEVLARLVKGVLHSKGDDESDKRLHKRVLELFGRISSVHPNKSEIWQLYSDMSPTYLLKGQRLLKAYRGYAQDGNWPANPETCKKVIELAQSLLEFSLTARKEATEKDKLQADQLLSSARLTGQAVLRAAERQAWPEHTIAVEELGKLLATVTEYMKSLL